MRIRCPNDPWDASKGNHFHEAFLSDDGTLDTVISVDEREFRFDGEYASAYRRRDGSMPGKGLRELARQCFEDIHERAEL